MANEFIARKGLRVLSSGVNITGSSQFSTDVTSSGNIKAVAFYGDGQYVTNVSASYVEYSNVANKPTLVSASNQIDVRNTIGIETIATTGSNIFVGNQTVSGSIDFGNGSTIESVAASSGDGNGYTTLQLKPDASVSTDQYIILDPTAPSHIHIRAGGTQDASNAVLILGGENSNFAVPAGSNPYVYITANSNVWNFNTDGTLSVPGDITGANNLATTGSNTFNGTQTVNGNVLLSATNPLVYNNDATNSMLFGFYDGGSIYGPYYQIFGNNYANAAQRGGAEFVYDTRNGGDGNFHVSSYDGSTWVQRFRVDDNGVQVTGSVTATTGFTGSFTGSFTGDGSGLTGIVTTLNTTGSTGTGTVDLKTQALTINGSNGVTTNASGQTITVSIPTGTVSSSVQVDVRNTTGIETIATTGSNIFTGIQTISNDTNSTVWNDGALIVAGGVGIEKDVNISGSLTVLGLLTAVSMSTQYVTSSEYTVGTSKIILNSDDLVRFAGISVFDSGSTASSGSLYWDSLNNRWIYENEGSATYTSAILISGPKNTGALGDEVGLIAGRIPVATGDDHIDTSIASSSIHIDFDTLRTHIEAGLTVTGSVSSSVGFYGDGSNLTGVVSTLAVTGSDGASITTGTVNLKTQALTVSAGEGIDVSVSGQTITVAGEDATTTNKGIASFDTNNFTVASGQVSAKNAVVNGVNVVLGSSINISLAEITNASATTPDQLVLNGGALIHGVLYTSGSATIPSPLNSVVATMPTGSYDAAHFDYVLKSGSNLRTGTVMAVWAAGTGNIEFTDTSTNDIGDTLSEVFTVDILSGNVRLKLTGDSNTWTVKTAIRMI